MRSANMITGLLAAFSTALAPIAVQAQYGVAVRSVRVGAVDVPKVASFYHAVLGLQEVSRAERSDLVEIIMNFGATAQEAKANPGPKVVVISRPAGAPAADPVSHLIFHCPDVAAAVARVTANGGGVERAPSKSASGSVVAMVTDPAGNRIELIQPAT